MVNFINFEISSSLSLCSSQSNVLFYFIFPDVFLFRWFHHFSQSLDDWTSMSWGPLAVLGATFKKGLRGPPGFLLKQVEALNQ